MKSVVFVFYASLAASLGFIFGDASPFADKTIVEVALELEQFSTLAELVVGAELVDALNGDDKFTVFAPTNDAFDKLFALDTQGYLGFDYNADLIKEVLLHHVVPGEVIVGNVSSAPAQIVVETLNEENIIIKPAASKVESGAGIEVIVETFDIIVKNGVIHIISDVLIPNKAPIPSLASEPTTITDIAMGSGVTNLLLAALEEVGLDTVFDSPSETGFTVFAPTDAAFEAALALLGVSLADLLADKYLLLKILKLHVVPGVFLKDFVLNLNGAHVPTLSPDGQTVGITVENDTIFVQGSTVNVKAKVIVPDVRGWNGVVHVIDAVLVPKGINIPETPCDQEHVHLALETSGPMSYRSYGLGRQVVRHTACIFPFGNDNQDKAGAYMTFSTYAHGVTNLVTLHDPAAYDAKLFKTSLSKVTKVQSRRKKEADLVAMLNDIYDRISKAGNAGGKLTTVALISAGNAKSKDLTFTKSRNDAFRVAKKIKDEFPYVKIVCVGVAKNNNTRRLFRKKVLCNKVVYVLTNKQVEHAAQTILKVACDNA